MSLLLKITLYIQDCSKCVNCKGTMGLFLKIECTLVTFAYQTGVDNSMVVVLYHITIVVKVDNWFLLK